MEKYTRKNNQKIKVGVFSVEDLKTDVFEKAWKKKSKETGLTDIDLKAINKNGKTFIELYLIPNKTDNDVKIKDWYIKNYPTDDLGKELNDEVTFEDMWNEDYKKYNVYQVMGVGDSVIRERLFEHLAEIKSVKYDVVYKKLFLSDGFYANGGGIGLRGNQSKIDMNKNGKIDAEDFTLLRGSMNGAWRNEHKHVNSTSTKYGKVIQYETRYARKHNPSRKGYKGKGNFEDGGYMDLSKIKANVVNESNPKDTALVPEIDIENVQKLNLDITDNQIKSEADAVRILKQLFDKNSINAYEEVKVLFLDNNNVVIGVYNHSKGGVTGTIVDVEMICALAVKCLAKGVIMCHNHPSGKLVFSDADKTTSLGLKKALNLFTIILLDSIVITNDGYISMSNQGYLERGGAIKYHRGGSLNQHGLEQGDTIIKTIGAFQKVKDKKGNIIYVDLSSGYRDTQPPLPFKVGGDLTFSEKSSAIAKKFEGQAVAPKYQRMYGKKYDKEEAKEVGNKITGKMVAMGMDKKALGGFFGKSAMLSTPKVSLQEKQVMLKSGEWVQVLDHSGDSLMVMDLNKLGTGVKPMRINISQVDTSSFMAGGKVVKSKPTTKKSSKPTKRGGAMQLAKEIRKVGEKWTDAVKRASAQLKK